ncbi:hypothetical protein ACSU64_04855 [Bacillaceae bacterium C204]
MMTPIGMPEFAPAIPTSGADIEPSTNGNKPNKAEALPAICPWVSIAKAKDVVPIILMEEKKRISGSQRRKAELLEGFITSRLSETFL